MSKVNQFLTEAGTFFLATSDNNVPHLRPLGLHLEKDGRIYYSVGDFKAVYNQIKANPMVELVAMKPDFTWIRVSGKAVFEDQPDLEKEALEASPSLSAVYNEKTGYHMAFFYLENQEAYLMDLIGNKIPLED